MKTLLITGGTGFFGNTLLKFFSNSKFLKKKINKIIIISRKKLQKFNYLKQLKKIYFICIIVVIILGYISNEKFVFKKTFQ
jgi:FlaA1/EpsC-like NDP-sugar epimerase